MIGNLLWTQDDAVAVIADVGHDVGQHFRTEREGGGRGAGEFSAAQELDHAVLDDLGVGGHVFEGAILQTGHYGVGDIPDARLQRQQRGRDASLFYCRSEELQNVTCDTPRDLVRLLKSVVSIRRVGLYNSNDFLEIHLQVGLADALAGVHPRDRLAIRRGFEAVVDVVHAFELRRLPAVDLQDHLFGAVYPGLVISDGRGGDQAAVFKDRGYLDKSHVHFAEKPIFHVLGDVAEVDVHVIHLTGVDPLARFGVGLLRKPEMNSAGHGERSIQFRAGRGSGENIDLKLAAAQVRVRDAAGERHWNRLGITAAGKAAHPDGGARAD